MLLKTLILPVLVSLTGVDATCHGSGEFFEPGVGKETVRNHIRNACYGWSGNRGAFQDTWFQPWSQSPYPATVKIYHWNSGLGLPYCIWLEVGNNPENGGRTLPQNLCHDGLMSEVNSCPRGGYSDKWGWHFHVDVNAGGC